MIWNLSFIFPISLLMIQSSLETFDSNKRICLTRQRLDQITSKGKRQVNRK